MKTVDFDMTPLAKALEMPSTTNKQPRNGTTKQDPVGIFPRHFAPDAGWLSTLAQEQIHALATHVLARHAEHGLRTLAVTSALAGEGKTTLTIALAERLASAHKRVLIIDLDAHRASLSRAADLGSARGALDTDIVPAKGERSPCYRTDCEGVSIMPTGKVKLIDGGVPLLAPDRILGLIKRGLADHDIVLLDCPPLMPVADTHVIAEVADSAILVVRAGHTPKEVLERALDDFGKEKFFAAVLNRARPTVIPYFREVYGYYRRTE